MKADGGVPSVDPWARVVAAATERKLARLLPELRVRTLAAGRAELEAPDELAALAQSVSAEIAALLGATLGGTWTVAVNGGRGGGGSNIGLSAAEHPLVKRAVEVFGGPGPRAAGAAKREP